MVKYHPYSRRRLRSLFEQWARRNWRLLGGVTAGVLVLLAFESWMFAMSGWSIGVRSYLMGSFHVLIVAAYVGTMWTSFLVNEREAILHVRGSWGEDFTKDELDRARRKKIVWGWVDSVTLQNGDIDHLVVTRSGGLVAIDSKWRSSPEDLDPAAIAQEASRARLRADGVVQTLLKAERGSHRASVKAFRVKPLVVIWGRGRDVIPEGAKVGEVDIIKGPDLLDWLRRLDADVIDEAAAADVLSQIERFRATAWPAGTQR